MRVTTGRSRETGAEEGGDGVDRRDRGAGGRRGGPARLARERGRPRQALGLRWAGSVSLGLCQQVSRTSVPQRTRVTAVPRGPEATQAGDCKTENASRKQEIPDAATGNEAEAEAEADPAAAGAADGPFQSLKSSRFH